MHTLGKWLKASEQSFRFHHALQYIQVRPLWTGVESDCGAFGLSGSVKQARNRWNIRPANSHQVITYWSWMGWTQEDGELEVLKVLGMLSNRPSGNCGKFFWKSDKNL